LGNERPSLTSYPRLHPQLTKWFRGAFENFTHAQLLCVPAILDQRSILLTSPTGSGKNLAGFLGILLLLSGVFSNHSLLLL
jgi:Lhr-like helicase